MANPRGQQRDKPFRDALRMAVADAEGDFRKLRRIADALIDRAAAGQVDAIREVADRLDGKVTTTVASDGELGPLVVKWEE